MKNFLILLVCLWAQTAALALDFGLEWDKNDPTEEVVGYKLYEKIMVQGQPTYVLVGSTSAAVSSISLTNVSPAAHIYVVTAYNDRGESGYSNECVVGKDPSAPRNLRIKIIQK